MQGESSDAKESPAYYIVKAALQSKEEGASMSKLMNSSDRATWAIIMGGLPEAGRHFAICSVFFEHTDVPCIACIGHHRTIQFL